MKQKFIAQIRLKLVIHKTVFSFIYHAKIFDFTMCALMLVPLCVE